MNYTKNLEGGQFGLLNTAQNSLAGLQLAGLMNLSDQVKGFQLHAGVVGNAAVQVDGAQFVFLAGYNLTDDINGVQSTVFGFNYANETVNGVQVALFYNYAKNLNGLQLGLINSCDNLSGIQIGLVNFIWQKEKSILPLINFRF